jgi:uridine phosphorylase
MKSSQQSDLILNSDGSVYHLQLLPHQISDTIITVGDPGRVDLVSQYFDSVDYAVQKREFKTRTGRIGNKQLTVLSTGIGTDNIDIVLNELHLLANYDFAENRLRPQFRKLTFIRAGTSGCIQGDIPVDSFLVSEYAIGIDNMLHFYAHAHTEEETVLLNQFNMHAYFHHTIHPYVTSASKNLIPIFQKKCLLGITLTTPGFYAPQGRNMILQTSMNNFYADLKKFTAGGKRITNIEMETAGLYGLSALLGHEHISCNVLLANRSTGEFSSDPENAVKKFIEMVVDTISTAL